MIDSMWGEEGDFLKYGFQTSSGQFCLDYKISKKIEKEQVRERCGRIKRDQEFRHQSGGRFLNVHTDTNQSISPTGCMADFLF